MAQVWHPSNRTRAIIHLDDWPPLVYVGVTYKPRGAPMNHLVEFDLLSTKCKLPDDLANFRRQSNENGLLLSTRG